MKVEQKDHTNIVKDTKVDLLSFIAAIESQISTFSKHNLIIDLNTHKNLRLQDILLFSEIAKNFKKLNKYHKPPKCLAICNAALDFI